MVTEVIEECRLVLLENALGRTMQKRQAGVAARHHERDVVSGGDWIQHAGQGVLLQPNLDVDALIIPQAPAVKLRGLRFRNSGIAAST